MFNIRNWFKGWRSNRPYVRLPFPDEPGYRYVTVGDEVVFKKDINRDGLQLSRDIQIQPGITGNRPCTIEYIGDDGQIVVSTRVIVRADDLAGAGLMVEDADLYRD